MSSTLMLELTGKLIQIFFASNDFMLYSFWNDNLNHTALDNHERAQYTIAYITQ